MPTSLDLAAMRDNLFSARPFAHRMGPLLQIQRQGCIEIVIGRRAIGLRVDLSTCLHRDRHFVTVAIADIEQTALGVDGGWLPDGVPALSVRIPNRWAAPCRSSKGPPALKSRPTPPPV